MKRNIFKYKKDASRDKNTFLRLPGFVFSLNETMLASQKKSATSKRKMLFSFLILLAFFSCLVSCKKTTPDKSAQTEETLPDMVLTDATYTFGESGRTPVIMSASKITIYNKHEDKTVLVNITFEQLSEKPNNAETPADSTESASSNTSSVSTSENGIPTPRGEEYSSRSDKSETSLSNAFSAERTTSGTNASPESDAQADIPAGQNTSDTVSGSDARNTSATAEIPAGRNTSDTVSGSDARNTSATAEIPAGQNTSDTVSGSDARESLTGSPTSITQTAPAAASALPNEGAASESEKKAATSSPRSSAPKNTNLFTEMSGSCNYAVITQNNTIATLQGDIVLQKKSDNFTIRCNDLVWDNNAQTIQTDGIVNVTYQDNTTIRARGFKGKLNENVYEFNTILEGSYKDEN